MLLETWVLCWRLLRFESVAVLRMVGAPTKVYSSSQLWRELLLCRTVETTPTGQLKTIAAQIPVDRNPPRVVDGGRLLLVDRACLLSEVNPLHGREALEHCWRKKRTKPSSPGFLPSSRDPVAPETG